MRLASSATAAALFFASSGAWAQSGAPASVDSTREAVGKWITTQRVIYQERKDWQQQKEILQSRVGLIGREISELEAKLAETRRAAAETNGKNAGARAATQQFADEAAFLASVLEESEQSVRRIHKLLPSPIQEKIQPLFQRIPEHPRDTRISVAERIQNVLGIMNDVNKAHREITLATEVRTLAAGKPS